MQQRRVNVGHVMTVLNGMEADFVVIDLHASELMQYRMAATRSLDERLFALMMLGDDRCVQATHVMGKRLYSRGH